MLESSDKFDLGQARRSWAGLPLHLKLILGAVAGGVLGTLFAALVAALGAG